jgi:putative FmdB family regulatory protein
MPFYDLRCIECGTEHNISASIKEKTDKLIPCPDCGSKELETVYKNIAYIKNMKSPACPNQRICGGCG